MRAHYIPALLAALALAPPLWAGMYQSARPAGADARPAFAARPPVVAPYAVPVQPRFGQPHQFYRGQGPHNGDWLRHTMRLPPQEQERRLEADPRFRQLSPQRQQELRNRLLRFSAMPPQEQQRVLNRMEMIEHLPPEQQMQTRELFGIFRNLDPQRKEMIRRTLRQMRTMPPDARERLLNSPATQARYSPQEILMLRAFNAIGFVGPGQE